MDKYFVPQPIIQSLKIILASRLAKIYVGISAAISILALCLFIYTLFQDDAVVFISLCLSLIVIGIEVRAIHLAMLGKNGLAIGVILLWAFAIFTRATYNDHQWQSQLLNIIFSLVTGTKIFILAMLIARKKTAKN